MDHFHLKYKERISNFILLNVFAMQVMTGTISNYSGTSIIIKVTASILLITLLLVETKRSGYRLSKILAVKEFKTVLLYLGLLVIVPAITLLYSANPAFGLEKVIHFIISPLFSVTCIFIITQIWDKEKSIMLKRLTVLYGIIIPLTVITADPFIYNTAYKLTWGRWSHVTLGRFLGALAVLSFYFLAAEKNKTEKILLLLSTIIVSYGVYFTGLRAALLGLGITVLLILATEIWKKKGLTAGTSMIIAAVIIISATIYFSDVGEIKSNRYESLTDIEKLEFKGDGAVIARLKAFRISLERFIENPVFGIGYGGFNSYYGSDLPLLIKYPHNIVLEFLAEMGLAGLVLMIFIFRRIYLNGKIDTGVMFYLLFALWLAMFSKDIATQGMLWVGLGAAGRQKTDVSKQRIEKIIKS